VTALLALSDTYGTTVGALFGELAESQAPLVVFPPDQPKQTANGLSIAACSGYPGSSVIDALRLSVYPDRVPPLPARHPGEECIYVIAGTLTLEFDGELHRLAAGTVAHFNAEVPHRLGAEGATAEVLLVAAKPLRHVHTVH
jgi:mannose-6-phosphate isomerase-like protein (cupin superfamily)